MVAGIGCATTYAAAYADFQEIKERFDSHGGRLAYHWEIAFAPKETYPQEAMEIAKAWADEILQGEYQCLIAVHDDKPHIHVHLIFNSVSMNDGHKFRYELHDLERKYYPALNRLCAKYGLSILDMNAQGEEKARQLSYKEWLEKKKGYATWRDMIRVDIDHAISLSYSYPNFLARLEEMGYAVNINGKYLKVTVPGMDGFMRTYKMGSEYTEERIRERIQSSELPKPRHYQFQKKVYRAKRNGIRRVKRPITRFQKEYFRYLYLLGKVRQQPYRKMTFMERQEASQIAEQMNFLFFHGIGNRNELLYRKQEIEQELQALEAKRAAIGKEQRKYSAIFRHSKEQMLSGDADGTHRKWLEQRGFAGEQGVAAIRAMKEELMERRLEVRQKKQELQGQLKMINKILNDSVRSSVEKMEQELDSNARDNIEIAQRWMRHENDNSR